MAAGGEGAEEDSTAAAVAEAAGDTLGLQGKLMQIDYDTIAQTGHTADDMAWAQGLDPIRDADIINTPHDRRYDEEDVEWVLQKLNQRIDYLEDQVKQEAAQAKQEQVARVETSGAIPAMTAGATTAMESAQFEAKLKGAGVDVPDMEQVIMSLSPQQMRALESLSDDNDDDAAEPKSADEIATAFRTVPGLSEEQIQDLVALELSLSSNDRVKALFLETNVKDTKK
jgi:hypothetical protein